ncbi:MAG: hypothetical protein PUB89_09800 [Oscillospiraceae bacterium]|nr:hypothetical protein [Oscillospiraceae bacterium]
MPITLIRNTKDNAMHGSDNDRYTGCRMKMQGGTWYTREGELKDITDLTCERCKEVFATKMIRESNKEELRIAKEEKKRYQRAKKQGIVREATYEEYLMNREAEASSKRDSRDGNATSASLHMLKDAIPSEQPVSQSVQFQSPFNPYNQTNSQPQVSAPQASFNPYAQPQVSAPQGPFNPYAQSQVSAPQESFNPYEQNVQSQISAPSFSQQINSSPAQPETESVAPSYQEYTRGFSGSGDNSSDTVSPASSAASDDDFLAQFMFKPAQEPEKEAPVSSVTADSIKSATDDILSQFNIGSQLAEKQADTPASSSIKADASSFYSNSIPVVGAEYAGASSVNSVVTEFGSLNIAESPKDDFVVPDVPVYQPQSRNYDSSVSAQLDEIAAPDVSSVSTAQSASNVSLQFADLASADMFSSGSADREEVSDNELEYGFDSFISDNPSVINDNISSTEDIMSGFGDIPAVPTINSFETVSPVQPAAPTMSSFETVSPVQPSAPTMSSFETVSPVQPAAPTMSSFETVSPVQPAVPTMNSFETVSPVQPATPTMSSFETISPVQPAAPTINGFGTVSPVQPAAPTINGFGSVSPVQPAAPAMNGFGTMAQQNPYSQSNMFQQPVNLYAQPQAPAAPQSYGAQQHSAPAPSPVFADKGGTADSIEEALRQLGAEVALPENQMPEKEEIVPDFVTYVPSSSKVLHSAPPVNTAQNAPKRPISAREAKQLAKIDAKFKKDLISRGFNPNELKNQRRGK